MSAPEIPSESGAADRLFRALTATHSQLAAALMVAAATGEWPVETFCRATVNATWE